MGYRKVYLTVDEEEDIQKVKGLREAEKRPGAAFNAILKEGLAMVVEKERQRRKEVRGTNEVVRGTNQSSSSMVAEGKRQRRRRRG